VNGAEPVRKDTLDRFSEFFEPSGFRYSAFCPGYGLAEATLKVTATTRREAPAIFGKLVGSGRHMNGTMNGARVEIVNPESRLRCAAEETGEIWVSGPSVTAGYWNKPGVNALTFEARIADTQEGPFLRTGDLGFMNGDHLVVTGRLKDLIIIRGQNHYPQDIERTSEQSHPALRQPGYCAAFAIDAGNEERLVIVQEVDRQHRALETESLIGTIRQAISETHELQAYEVVLVPAGVLPKTSSGKIQRQACKAAYLEGKFKG
jgi:acyl-CoA synthetase (AMP-forming)/AMP-acid ligase II